MEMTPGETLAEALNQLSCTVQEPLFVTTMLTMPALLANLVLSTERVPSFSAKIQSVTLTDIIVQSQSQRFNVVLVKPNTMMDNLVALVMTNHASCTPLENPLDVTQFLLYDRCGAVLIDAAGGCCVNRPSWRTGTTDRGWSFTSRESGSHYCKSLGMDREWSRHWPVEMPDRLGD